MQPKSATRPTLRLNPEEWDKITRMAGLLTEAEQAKALGINRVTLNRVRNGHAVPGPEFIAAVRLAFPWVHTDVLFPVVEKRTAA